MHADVSKSKDAIPGNGPAMPILDREHGHGLRQRAWSRATSNCSARRAAVAALLGFGERAALKLTVEISAAWDRDVEEWVRGESEMRKGVAAHMRWIR
jgi:hypothetical protein